MAKGKKTGGRVAGTPNKATAEVKAIAREYTDRAIKCLVGILEDKEAPPAARVSAARELLDRGHGKAPQALTGEDGAPLLPTIVIHRMAP